MYAALERFAMHPNPEIQQKFQTMFFKLHKISKKFSDERDGYDRQGIQYTFDEKVDLLCHMHVFLSESKPPDFDYISEHMCRTPTALEQQAQKILLELRITPDDLMNQYGLSRMDANKLSAPQHYV